MDRARFLRILEKFGGLSVAVVGDYCLDEYLTIDPQLDEPSLETGLTAYQVVKRETSPGAAGTVSKNFALLGVKKVYSIGFVGDDGRGLELRRGLDGLGIDCGGLVSSRERITPAYVKPWMMENGTKREMNRLDVKNRTATPAALEDELIGLIRSAAKKVCALVVMDQMTERNCGAITDRVRAEIIGLAKKSGALIAYADSRCRISEFTDMIIKGNQFELTGAEMNERDFSVGLSELARRCVPIAVKNKKPVVATLGENGAAIIDGNGLTSIPGFFIDGQIDVCGGGDAFTSGFVAAFASGASLAEAALTGNLSASICVTQLGSTGTVTREMMAERLEASLVSR
ncbi:MAG: PfkB family carbohydrate kinase [Defluviitaleaceae bacterium]|nr:PfkB family carbohydrate kinase [Defluviitaleaceae bacterium]